jgi:hypothetical protein
VAVEIGSNKLVNDIFEAKMGATSKLLKPYPQADLPMRLSYITEKYQHRAYLDLEVLAIVLKELGDEKSTQAALLRRRLEYGDMDDNRPVSQRSPGWKEERSLSFHLVSETDLNIFHGMSQVDLFSDSKKDMFCDMSAAGESSTEWLYDPQLSNSSLLFTSRDDMFVGGSYCSRRNVKLVDDVKDQSLTKDGSLEKNRKGSRKKDDAMKSKKSKSIDSSDKSAGNKEKKKTAKHLGRPKVVTPEEIMAVLKGTATKVKGITATKTTTSIKGKANKVAKKRSKRTKSKERV